MFTYLFPVLVCPFDFPMIIGLFHLKEVKKTYHAIGGFHTDNRFYDSPHTRY